MVISNFSEYYRRLNLVGLDNWDSYESRNGPVLEELNNFVEIHNPYRRCVGGNHRNINIFFLIAESMWIFSGRRDVEFLTIFNSNMVNFSDDGFYFNAPYGWRIRNYGIDATSVSEQSNIHAFQGLDQLQHALIVLGEKPDSRRVVMQIWNPEFDLINQKSKDLACNTQMMLKVRHNGLHTLITNRSNDLHWGLPTNVFQFSFMGELISNILEIEYKTQAHISQSLHIYKDNPIAETMKNSNYDHDLYEFSSERKIDMDFSNKNLPIYLKIKEIDYWLKEIINSLLHRKKKVDYNINQDGLKQFSNHLFHYFKILNIFVDYTNSRRDEDSRIAAHMDLLLLGVEQGLKDWDIFVLALNWFNVRIKTKESGKEFLGKL